MANILLLDFRCGGKLAIKELLKIKIIDDKCLYDYC